MTLDWISGLWALLSPGEEMILTPDEYTTLRRAGIELAGATKCSGSRWLVKVSDPQRARAILSGDTGRQPARGLGSVPEDWTCRHCGSRLPHHVRKCPNCGAPRR